MRTQTEKSRRMIEMEEIKELFQKGVMMQTKRTCSQKSIKITEKHSPGKFSWKALGLKEA